MNKLMLEAALRNRKNKTSVGMTRTIYRHNARSNHSTEASRLSVHGTLDSLAGLKNYDTIKLACGSCGCKCNGKVALSDRGKQRLARLKRRQHERETKTD